MGILITSKVYGQLPTRESHKDIPQGAYSRTYNDLSKNSIDSIKSILYKTLSYKNLDSLCLNERDAFGQYPTAWHVLMRMAEIDWKDEKYEAIDLLHSFSQQLLSGQSYLTLSDLDKFQDLKDVIQWVKFSAVARNLRQPPYVLAR